MRWNKRQISTGAIVLSILAGFTFIWIRNYQKHEKIKTALAFGRLAPIPENATDINVEMVGNLFSRTFYISFESSDTEINEWIKQSASLRNRRPIRLVGQKEAISLSEPPSWFDIRFVKRGQLYKIPQLKEAYYGIVIIDRERNRVYITTSYS